MDDIAAAGLAERLRGPAARGELVLFTGSGFTTGAPNAAGTRVPSSEELRHLIWAITFGGPVDNESSLQEVFEVARRERPDELAHLLREQLTIDSAGIGSRHLRWLNFPWRRAYTVNVDDLEQAASSRDTLSRTMVTVSALRNEVPPTNPRDLAWIHLNGDLRDVPDVTFTEQQYGARTTREDVLFSRLVSDLNVAPVVFVGSTLREAQLWRYLELRRLDSPEHAALQPTSFLVTPSLPRARVSMLSAMNIEWVQADADEFADNVLVRLSEEATTGRRSLALLGGSDGLPVLQSVNDLLGNPSSTSESMYLEGAQPTWEDIKFGRTASRRFEADLPIEDKAGTVLVTSTAGEGTSTTLMRLAARLQASGRETLWCSARQQPSGQRLRAQVRNKRGNFALVVDDADMLGLQLEYLQRDMQQERDALLLIGMRSSRIDAALPAWDSEAEGCIEVNVPKLRDDDIRELLALLERESRLGLLTTRSPDERFSALKDQTGRLLLVAMLMVTEGHDLREKVEEEFTQLAQPQRAIYGAIALASQHRYRLTQDEALQAANAMTAVGATALERLAKRNLVLVTPDGYESRHRTVAELVIKRMREDGTLPEVHARLLTTVAVRHSPEQLKDPKLRQKSARYRLTQTLMNHRALETYRLEEGRALYREAEPYLTADYHFWLQRGSFEVRRQQFDFAQRYLNRAKLECVSGDFRVDVEWFNMLLQRAVKNPSSNIGRSDADEAYAGLRALIDERGDSSGYMFHVLLSQYPRWLERSGLSLDDKKRRFEKLRVLGDRAVTRHGNDAGMRDLRRDLEKAYLSLGVPPRSGRRSR